MINIMLCIIQCPASKHVVVVVVTTAVQCDGGHVVTECPSGARVVAMLAGPLRSESPRQLSQVTALAACLDPRPPDSPAASYLWSGRGCTLIRDSPDTAGFTFTI